ncbi:MAG: segregation/condensation protein A [Candidatus Pacebacteria bacterium]|nr:segregation/condensation protein A [Candidatus Paceibacterota bacterium]
MYLVEPYQLRTDVFEGPLEVLLVLIEKRKLLINDIALAEVTDDFLKYIERHPEFPVSETAQFVLVGSALLLIKSKSLLPILAFTPEEEGSIEDLEKRLRLLEKYKIFAKEIAERFGKTPLYSRTRILKKEPVFSPDASMTVPTLAEAIRSVLAHLPRPIQKLPEATVRKVVSIEEMMNTLTKRINASMEVSFREAVGGVGHKVNVIVTFLAMLELVRQGVIRVEQDSHYSDITMKSDSVGLPRYI